MQNETKPLSILTVEDSDGDLFLIQRMLESTSLVIGQSFTTDRISEARRILQSSSVDLVLLDLTLPDSFGIDSYNQLKPLVASIPVIILSGMADTCVALEAIKEGAQDYLVKGEFNGSLLEKSIQYSVERKRNLENLRVSNERFNMVAMATNDIIWDWDILTNDVMIVGDNYKQILGYDFEGAVSSQKFWEDCLHPEDRGRVMNKLWEIIADAKQLTWEDEFRLRRSDGQYAYMHDQGYIMYREGRPVRMIGAMQDITSRKLSEESIRISEEKYRQIFYKNPFPTWIHELDEDLQILEVNDAAIERYDYSKEEFLRLTMYDLHAGTEGEEFANVVKGRITLLRPERKLWHHVSRTGKPLIVEITFHPIDYYGRVAMQVIVNDVTEKIRLERELARQQRLRQQQITEEVLGAQERERYELGQELHDNINQILATSKLYLDVAIEDPEEPKDEWLIKSRKTVTQAIEEIRKLSKELINPTLNDMGLVHSIRELIRGIQSVKRVKIGLKTERLRESSLPPEQKVNLYRIIQEQLNNILKHSQASSVLIELEMTDGQIHLQIRDNGKGFDPRSRRQGVGISNIISRAELYNGKVEINSAPGKGCNLDIRLNSKILPEQV